MPVRRPANPDFENGTALTFRGCCLRGAMTNSSVCIVSKSAEGKKLTGAPGLVKIFYRSLWIIPDSLLLRLKPSSKKFFR